MCKPEISVGRGGRSAYCDLELEAPADISRQHFYLRQDPETRDFFVQDVSRFGTVVNDAKLAPKEWVRIAPKAVIRLADKIAIEFEAL
jgi:predicted component of type VI protein secretion system